MSIRRVKTALFGFALVTAGVVIGGEAAFAYQGHMLAARQDLQAARAQLNAALPDKAGHRISAIDLVNQALQQTNAGLSAGAR